MWIKAAYSLEYIESRIDIINLSITIVQMWRLHSCSLYNQIDVYFIREWLYNHFYVSLIALNYRKLRGVIKDEHSLILPNINTLKTAIVV